MTKPKINPGKRGRKPGSRNKVPNHAEQELLADVMVEIARVKSPSWQGADDGWSSEKDPAIHRALNKRGIRTSEDVDRLPGRKGKNIEVTRGSRFKDISRQLEASQRAEEFSAAQKDMYSPLARMFALGVIRKFAIAFDEQIGSPEIINPVARAFRIKMMVLRNVEYLHLARHHADRSGEVTLRDLDMKARRHLTTLVPSSLARI